MWLAVLVIVLAVCLLLYVDTLKPRRFPPGPKWVPILGCAREVNKLRKKTGYLYKAVKELSNKYCKDGPVLGLKIGQDKIVIVNSLEANREVLSNEDLDGRPKGIFYRTRTWGESLGVLLTDGELWKEHRKFLFRTLKEYGFGREGMGQIATTEAIHMVHDVKVTMNKNGGKGAVLHMHNFFNTYILNTLWTMMAGLRYHPSDPEMMVLQSLLFDLFAAVDMVGTAFSHFPVLRFVAPTMSGYTEFVKTHERLWKFLRAELARHKDNFNLNGEDKDLMDTYIRILRENGEINTYSEGQLIAMCMDLFMAGTETTSKSMSFCFSYMLRYPEIQRKAQAEIDKVVGKDRMPNLDDRPNMPYNEGLMLECIRHFMGRTFGVPHRAQKDTQIAGYDIPKDTMVVNNFTNILMDESYYPDPYSFKPERFHVDGKICAPDHYFPFGMCKHRCVGEVLAKCNIFIFTTNMLQRFTFLPAPGEPLPSMDHVEGATPSAAPFKALIVPRI